MAWLGVARHGKAGTAGQGMAWQGVAGTARHGMAWQGVARIEGNHYD